MAGGVGCVDVFGADGEVRPELLRARTRFYVGVDLGQAQSHTAIAVVERAELVFRDGPRDARTYSFPTETQYFLRHAERLRLGVAYTDVVERLRALVRRPALRGAGQVVVDATGVGAPVVELLRGSGGLGCPLIPVVITSGEMGSAALAPDGVGYRVPKRDLVHGLVVAFENGVLRMAGDLGVALEVLVKELTSVRVRRGGSSVSGAPSDDLVLALALAWWKARREQGRLG